VVPAMKKILFLTIIALLIFSGGAQTFAAQTPQRGNYVPADLDTTAHPFIDHYRFGGAFFRGRLIKETPEGWETEIYLENKTKVVLFPPNQNNLKETYRQPGQRVLIKKITGSEDIFLLSGPDRIRRYILLVLFCLVLCALAGGLPTIRGLSCVAGGVLFFLFWTLPQIQNGSPVLFEVCLFYLLVTVFVLPSSLGFNKRALSATLAALSTGIISVIILLAITSWIPVTGLYDETIRALEYSIRYFPDQVAPISLRSLGVILDVAIDVTASASEIAIARPELPFSVLLKRTMTVCRRLVGTMANTLLLAYVGTDMLLLFSLFLLPEALTITFNRDMIALEIIRALGGAIGFLAAVPLAVAFYSFLCLEKTIKPPPPEKNTADSTN
jgi:uncharacterized membrane protein